MSNLIYKTSDAIDSVSRAWLNHIFLRSHRYKFGHNFLLCGEGGSGKDWTALNIIELLSIRGIDDNNVAFTPDGYLDTLNDARIGDCVLWSEVGVGMGARDWNTLSNKLLTKVVQTMRKKRVIVMMTTPDLSFLDVQARKMLNGFGIVKRNGLHPPVVSVHNISVDRICGKIYTPHPLIKINDEIVKLRNITFKRIPSEGLLDIFEKKEVPFKRQIESEARGMYKAIQKREGGSVSSQSNMLKAIEDVRKNPDRFKNRFGRIDEVLIETTFNIPENQAMKVKKLVDYESYSGKKNLKDEIGKENI